MESIFDPFVKHAFLFYRNAHRIMSDSRMFLARVPIINGLAYSGTAGFETPTLGVYIEWWIHGKGTITSDGKGHEALTFHFGGSPLSGNNICSCVYPDQHTATITHYPFRPVWKIQSANSMISNVLKQALKRGELTLQKYQRFVTPLSKRRKEIEHQLAAFRPSRVKEFSLYDDITCEMVEDFLDSETQFKTK